MCVFFYTYLLVIHPHIPLRVVCCCSRSYCHADLNGIVGRIGATQLYELQSAKPSKLWKKIKIRIQNANSRLSATIII